MSTQFLLISRLPVKPGTANDLVSIMPKEPNSRIFTAIDGDEIVVLRTLDASMNLANLSTEFGPVADDLAVYLTGDISRELLEYVEAAKSTGSTLPDTPYIQLRHVEVKPEAMSDYREWREETIFDVVRNADEVEVFLAYHSVISGQPGVMFVSGFSANPDRYEAVFGSDRYQTIVQEAGDQFITGGTNGLYTKIYEDVGQRVA